MSLLSLFSHDFKNIRLELAFKVLVSLNQFVLLFSLKCHINNCQFPYFHFVFLLFTNEQISGGSWVKKWARSKINWGAGAGDGQSGGGQVGYPGIPWMATANYGHNYGRYHR